MIIQIIYFSTCQMGNLTLNTLTERKFPHSKKLSSKVIKRALNKIKKQRSGIPQLFSPRRIMKDSQYNKISKILAGQSSMRRRQKYKVKIGISRNSPTNKKSVLEFLNSIPISSLKSFQNKYFTLN